jgi:hypothetical protein
LSDILHRFGLRLRGEMTMAITIKPSDLFYKYPKDTLNRHGAKFRGKPDPAPFNRDDLYEVIPMLEQVMAELGRDDAFVLHAVEELMICNLPRFIATREEVFDFLVGYGREILDNR